MAILIGDFAEQTHFISVVVEHRIYRVIRHDVSLGVNVHAASMWSTKIVIISPGDSLCSRWTAYWCVDEGVAECDSFLHYFTLQYWHE